MGSISKVVEQLSQQSLPPDFDEDRVEALAEEVKGGRVSSAPARSERDYDETVSDDGGSTRDRDTDADRSDTTIDAVAEIERESRSAANETRFAAAPASVVAAANSDETSPWDPKRVDASVVAFHNRYSSICEQYRGVRARLSAMNAEQQNRVIVITSSVPEEGKSVTTINLGVTMAEGGEHRILIADTDFRRSSVAKMVGVQAAPGLAEVFLGKAALEEVIRPTPYPNLKIIPAGRPGAIAYGDLLASPRIPEIMAQLRSAFTWCFLDTPPVTTVSDVSLLAPIADGALMLVEMGRTPEPTVQLAVRTLQTNNVNVLGAILSRHRDERKQYYDRYYGYYHRGDRR